MPSTRKPLTSAAIAFWKARTDASVFGPNRPSTVSVRPPVRFRKLIWSWTARTAGPLLPRCTVTASDRQVAAWTTPVAGRPFLCWKATTAALVLAPNTPSTASLAPFAFSRYCNDRTVAFGQVLLLPWRSSGQLSTLAVVVAAAAATVGPLVAAPAGGTATPAIPAASTAAKPAAPSARGTRPLIEILPI